MLTSHQTQFIRDGYRQFLASPRFDQLFDQLHPSRSRILQAGLLITFLKFRPGLAFRAYHGAKSRGFGTRKLRRQYQALADTGKPIMTRPVIYNSMALRRRSSIAPAMVLATFDDAVDESWMNTLAGLVGMAYENPRVNPELAAIVKDDSISCFRRRRIPDDLAEGHDMYLFDILLVGDFLPTGMSESPLIPCIAEPGTTGPILMLPPDIVVDACSTKHPSGSTESRPA